jgi:hypothetical protein
VQGEKGSQSHPQSRPQIANLFLGQESIERVREGVGGEFLEEEFCLGVEVGARRETVESFCEILVGEEDEKVC